MVVKKKKKAGSAGRAARDLSNVDDLMELSTQRFKKQVLFRAVEAPHRIRYRIPTSSLILNRLLGGGVAVPRITQVYGPSNVYKTTLIYDIIANAQAMGKRCVHYDTENASDPAYMERWGIDTDKLLIANPETADEAIASMIDMLRADRAPEVMTLDSLNGLVTQREIDKGNANDDAFVDSQNKLQGWMGKFNSIAFRHLNNENRGTTALLFANQMRDNMGDIIKAARDGGKTKPSGGHAPKYYSSDILYMEHEAAIRGDYTNIPVGDTVRKRKKFQGWIIACMIEKTRTTANDGQELFFRFWPERSEIDHIGEVIDLGRMDGLIEQRGAYFYYNDKSIGQGMLNLRKSLILSRECSDEMLSEGQLPEDELYFGLRCAIEEKSQA